MRLTHLKLAGFKSFVDPTTLHIHGQRVGVVGPNGCGKSNVMESVRWVLGESSAKEMRGDSMDAVIFNGSGNRKPISRASVELIFDNSLGGAAGEWSQYAEISVKRVIERDKGSTYFINNMVVRRRDVADLFLGTGLGGRAYAIIGQNTINRIVEAKPEELRVFLEEAAGISKYKERRRETELRLRDTRENLTRVEDILRELDTQIGRLQSQAVVAEHYHRLHDSLKLTKSQIWLFKKREASNTWERAQRTVQKLVNELEAQMASLRSSETALEFSRQQHATTTEALNQAQAHYYEANAEVSNLENQVKNNNDARERMQLQLQQLGAQLEKNQVQHTDALATLALSQATMHSATDDYNSAELILQKARDALPVQAQQYEEALASFNRSHSILLEAEQGLRLEQSNATHIQHAISETHEQLQRLQQNLAGLQVTNDAVWIDKQTQLSALELEISVLEKSALESTQEEQAISVALKASRDLQSSRQHALSALEAELASLLKIQQAMRSGNNEATLSAWLKVAGFDADKRIWQTISIKPGWETAVEAMLGARLNAIAHSNFTQQQRPPGALTLAITDGSSLTATQASNGKNSGNKVSLHTVFDEVEPQCQAVLQDWLAAAYLLEDGVNPKTASSQLAYGESLVNKHGDIYTRHSVTYYGAQSLLHGVLERQAQLEVLQQQQPSLMQELVNAKQQTLQLEQSLQSSRTSQQMHATQLKALTQQAHQFNLALQQIKQQQAHVLQRQKMLHADVVLAEAKLVKLSAEKSNNDASLAHMQSSLPQLQADKLGAEDSKQVLEVTFNSHRNALQSTESAHQEKNFNLKLINNNINELNSKINQLLDEERMLKMRFNEVEVTLNATKMETLKVNLEAALNQKQLNEQRLLECRNAMSECEQQLQQQERTRMQNEHLLHPLRDKLEASRLSEQESRLYFEQCQAELNACGVDEALISETIVALKISAGNETLKVADLELKRTRLEEDIAELGAVNLAAIEELGIETTRKGYLDSQCLDLREASDTLEQAIRRIDRETSSRLQATFDEANRHFNDIFTTLFGGGQARLELLGEEILDTGMQVFAQPPGKKNSTIHLLSGGEKALTALALVFALFRLNPAPFCLMDEVDAPLDDSNTERFCALVKKMSEKTQFLYVSHNKITMEMAQQLIGVTMQESGVSRIVDVDMEAAIRMAEEVTT